MEISVLAKYQYYEGLVRVICTDGEYFDAYIEYINDLDDYEDGIHEYYVDINTISRGSIVIKESEIADIIRL